MKPRDGKSESGRMKATCFTWIVLMMWGLVLSGCVHSLRPSFVDVASPLHSAEIAVIAADDDIVRLRISGPNQPVFLAMVEPKVVGDGLYLFPSYISKPTGIRSLSHGWKRSNVAIWRCRLRRRGR